MRMLSQVKFRVKNLDQSRVFYKAVVETLGHHLEDSHLDYFAIDHMVFVQGSTHSQGMHLTFTAPNAAVVKLFHQTALEFGGKCNGSPMMKEMTFGFQASVLDPDGHRIDINYEGYSQNHLPHFKLSEVSH
jgi:predicted lactoylglutathione lyase